jgi:hypothetical protein
MAVLPGFEDLHPKRVIGFNPFDTTVECVGGDGKLMVMGLYVGSSGALMARPLEAMPIDQLATSTAIPHRGVDQV